MLFILKMTHDYSVDIICVTGVFFYFSFCMYDFFYRFHVFSQTCCVRGLAVHRTYLLSQQTAVFGTTELLDRIFNRVLLHCRDTELHGGCQNTDSCQNVGSGK